VSHRNAPLTPTGRLLLCQRIEAGSAIAHVADAMGISRQCAHKWWARYCELGEPGLEDRSSRPHTSPTRTHPRLEAKVLRKRSLEKLGPHRIGHDLGLSPSTVYQVLVRHDASRLSDFDRASGRRIRRYERTKPGELVHIDVKKLGKIPAGRGPQGPRSAEGQAIEAPAGGICLCPLRGRRLLPPGLLRGPPRRERPHLCGVLAPGPGLLPGPRGRGRAGHDRQRLRLQGREVQRGPRRDPGPAPLLPALPAPDQRQGL